MDDLLYTNWTFFFLMKGYIHGYPSHGLNGSCSIFEYLNSKNGLDMMELWFSLGAIAGGLLVNSLYFKVPNGRSWVSRLGSVFFSSILGSIKSRSGTTWKVWYFMRYFVVHQQFGGRKQIHYSPTLVNISSPNPIQWLVIWKWVNTYQLPSFLGDQHPLTSYCSPGWGLL